MAKVKRDAERYKAKDLDLITADTDINEQAGEWVELDNEGMCIVLLKYWKENGTVHFRKSTKNVIIVEDEDTLLTRYPIAFFNWESVKNSFHGVSDVNYGIKGGGGGRKRVESALKSHADMEGFNSIYDIPVNTFISMVAAETPNDSEFIRVLKKYKISDEQLQNFLNTWGSR